MQSGRFKRFQVELHDRWWLQSKVCHCSKTDKCDRQVFCLDQQMCECHEIKEDEPRLDQMRNCENDTKDDADPSYHNIGNTQEGVLATYNSTG